MRTRTRSGHGTGSAWPHGWAPRRPAPWRSCRLSALTATRWAHAATVADSAGALCARRRGAGLDGSRRDVLTHARANGDRLRDVDRARDVRGLRARRVLRSVPLHLGRSHRMRDRRGAPGCAAAKTETDFCAWTPDEAMRHARDACGRLGACEAPWATMHSPCYFRALMAYDCAANPAHRPREKARGLWDCLQQVKSCADVDACMFPDAPAPGCDDAGTYASCSETNKDVRRLCPADGGPSASSSPRELRAWGPTQRPFRGAGHLRRRFDSALPHEPSRRLQRQDAGTGAVHRRDDGGPGVDCGIQRASNGAGGCGGFPGAPCSGSPASRTRRRGTAASPASTSATCDGGRATTAAALGAVWSQESWTAGSPSRKMRACGVPRER